MTARAGAVRTTRQSSRSNCRSGQRGCWKSCFSGSRMGLNGKKGQEGRAVSRFGFPGTIGERQRSLPAPAETKSPYTTTAKSAFLFVCVLWGLGGQVVFNSCIPSKTQSPLPAESRGRGAERDTGGHWRARTIQTAQEGPHSFPVHGLYKRQLKTNHFFYW